VLDASFYEMNGPLVTAVSTNRNMPVVADKGYSLWALKSNEFQVHRDSNPDGTKLVVASGVCGAVTPPPAPPAPAPPPLFGSSSTSYTATSTFSGSTRHVVQRGENLFRISLRYGRSMASIAAANGISNYNLIYAGQTLIIP
jgi:LysM repeat protein